MRSADFALGINDPRFAWPAPPPGSQLLSVQPKILPNTTKLCLDIRRLIMRASQPRGLMDAYSWHTDLTNSNMKHASDLHIARVAHRQTLLFPRVQRKGTCWPRHITRRSRAACIPGVGKF